ncbi:AmpG family muropeptide MFS transporter [Desulfofustis limnaeus]|uniref:MFS transporter n=1 Tax=Desulfofustis limnaeus TaxID=2740163 RepID=A0ABN6M1Z0_9BACT|nr:MFS transporter [Desulfofustis limnaeus]BDD86870.1 MFS transporter [Desulfofustis limnaeus]
MTETTARRSWTETLRSWLHPRVVTMLFFGFSAGLPLLLIFGTLSAWLTEAGVTRSAVTFFSWAALGYSFKFIWAPLIDRLPLPYLTRRLGRRRAWMATAQVMIMIAILAMGAVDPASGGGHLVAMAWAAVLLGFSAATQDIVIDAYRIECAEQELQALLSASYIAGYRIGMLVAGAGSLALAAWLGSSVESYSYTAWRLTYGGVALCMLIGLATTLLIPEPEPNRAAPATLRFGSGGYLRFFLLFLGAVSVFVLVFFAGGSVAQPLKEALRQGLPGVGLVAGFLVEALRLLIALLSGLAAARLLVALRLVPEELLSDTYIAPVKDFFTRYSTKMVLGLLLLIGFYRVSDIVLGVISTVFYLDLGFTKTEIAAIVQTFGLLMTIIGGFLGGMLTVRYGVIKMLFVGGVLAAATNVLFMVLAQAGPDPLLLKVVVGADNLAAGMASAAFVAFLSSLTSVSFTAVQYAVFSSLMTLFPKLIGGYSGTIVTAIGYPSFFMLTALLGVPVLILIWLVRTIR